MAKICLDAGHGGRDSGAVGFGRLEKDDVLKMVLKVGTILSGKGHTIYYTRDNDIYESPITKATEANNAEADFFASFHRNSAANAEASGYETLVYADDGQAKICADYVNSEMEQLGFRKYMILHIRQIFHILLKFFIPFTFLVTNPAFICKTHFVLQL